MLLHEGVFDPTEVEFFNREGYIIAENVFEPSDLEPLRGALNDAIDEKIEELRQAGLKLPKCPKIDFFRKCRTPRTPVTT